MDFDWRFDAKTVEHLAHILRGRRVLAIGTPSVARRLEAMGEPVFLVDRQPLQDVEHHLVVDVRQMPELQTSFDVALIDPPWYPADLNAWARAGGRAVGPGKEVLVSVWPETTRPAAQAELDALLVDLSNWADVEIATTPTEVTYDAPPFELAASECALGPLSRSPRTGALLRLMVREMPELAAMESATPLWHRFAADGYQLALRNEPSVAGFPLLSPHPDAQGWRWPYVSARAPRLQRIGLWSSAGEVAQVGSPKMLLQTLQRAFAASERAEFEDALAEVPALLSWLIPRPPYRSFIQWQHP